MYGGWRASWTGFYKTETSVMKRVNALLLACIHWDIFLDYDEIIDIYASKYQKSILLINPLSKTKLLKGLTLKKHVKFT